MLQQKALKNYTRQIQTISQTYTHTHILQQFSEKELKRKENSKNTGFIVTMTATLKGNLRGVK